MGSSKVPHTRRAWQLGASLLTSCETCYLQHATRVSALSTALLAAGHSVALVTNAPLLPFAAVLPPSSDSDLKINHNYATYRKRNVDAGIVQPKAYDVDRRATFEVLSTFLDQREGILEEEERWLRQEGIECVLSDATFLGWSVLLFRAPSLSCASPTYAESHSAAAAKAGLPSIIVSKWSILCAPPW